ncbi:anaerobic ribonucleoside-triphosphate reductase activating protein [Actinobaculum sp. 352]|nr:anaerobic ribonucleoside-triphosphate reductase activating protein [Actinobaculum sp. 313]RTE49368.1 anaerobic ribonucleoside-triphosphate reductase activating protein [Actinobaculum sp. 352]
MAAAATRSAASAVAGRLNSLSAPVADDVAIAGFVPLSSVDWPDHLVTTVFLQGCPWRCPYCQNSEILDSRTPGIVPWQEVTIHLRRRRGLLDGVVFTGGEALRQAALIPAMREVRDLGFQVGLHTGGAYPKRLREALELTDWVGLDVKALPDDYRSAAGVAAGDKAWESLDIMLAIHEQRAGSTFPLDYEVRTTVYPGSPSAEHFTAMVETLRARGVRRFALQEARTTGTDPIFQEMARRWDMPAWRRRFTDLTVIAQNVGFDWVEVRDV